MSTARPINLPKPAPRWSNSGTSFVDELPASIAGLVWINACVCVGPPLSLRGPNNSLADRSAKPLFPTTLLLTPCSSPPDEANWPIRLNELLASMFVFPAMSAPELPAIKTWEKLAVASWL